MSSAEMVEVESHLAECDRCANLMVSVQQSMVDLAALTPAALGEAYREAQQAEEAPVVVPAATASTVSKTQLREGLLAVMQGLKKEDEHWGSRVRAWLEKTSGKGDGAVRVAVQTGGTGIQLVLEALESVLLPEARLRFAYAYGPGAVPMSAAEESVETDEALVVAMASEIAPATRVRSDLKKRAVVVEMDYREDVRGEPLVVLVPLTAGNEPELGQLTRRPGENVLSVEFANMASGDYLLVIEPLHATGTR